MAKEKMMPYMTGQEPGYKPPTGSAGKSAFGAYSTKKNPLSVPKKGSQMSNASNFAQNADRNKAMASKDAQARNETLRGLGT